MKQSLEKINKHVLLVALIALQFRNGTFYNSHIPKPFEMLFVLLMLLTAVDVLKNRKIKVFFLSIPKKVLIAIGCMVGSFLLGWAVAVFLKKIPLTSNMILEFGSFLVSLGTFLLVLFYAKDDQLFVKKYFYALLLPVLYGIFLLLPQVAVHVGFAKGGNFFGFTDNQNIISKMMLIPALFFIVAALFESKSKAQRVWHMFSAALLVALLFWTGSRGALLSLVLGSFFSWIIFTVHHARFKKAFFNGLIVVGILMLGFIMTPYSGKQVVLNRILNPDNRQFDYTYIQNKNIADIVHDSLNNNGTTGAEASDTRLEIWPYYFKQIIRNPFGFGPDTHMKSGLVNKNGEYLNTGPHNTYLQVWLWGGIIGIISFLFLLYCAFHHLKMKLRAEFSLLTVALLATLFTFSVAIMFDDSLSLYCFWAVLALSLRA